MQVAFPDVLAPAPPLESCEEASCVLGDECGDAATDPTGPCPRSGHKVLIEVTPYPHSGARGVGRWENPGSVFTQTLANVENALI